MTLMRRLAAVEPVVADSLLALVLVVPLLVDFHDLEGQALPPPFRAPDALGYVLVALLLVPLALRRVYPMAVFSVILGASVATAMLGYRPVSYGFGLIVATYTVARWCDRSESLVALGLAIGFSIFIKARFIHAGIDIELFNWPLDAAYFAGAWFLGDSIQTRTRQAGELARNREALATQAVEREHLRIARDLHDSVGHSLSVMVLYTGAAEQIAISEPERARALLGTVAGLGRDALAEMDDLVRVLRADASPSAGIEDIDALAHEFQSLGIAVSVRVDGQARSLPDAVGLTAYRVVQEALTNSLRHAHASRVEVRVEYESDALTVNVVDDGQGCDDMASASSNRHGIAGMRERTEMLGGTLELGCGPDGRGFRVTARLPIGEEPSR